MIPPAWLLPATILLDEAQRDGDGAMVEAMCREVWLMFKGLRVSGPAEARELLDDHDWLAGIEVAMRDRWPECADQLLRALDAALYLSLHGLIPNAMTFEPTTTPDGQRGCWVQIRRE